MQMTESEWQLVIDVMTREFGEDKAQDCIVEILEYQARRRREGQSDELENPLALARVIACYNTTDELRSRGGIVEIPMSQFTDREAEGFSLPSNLHDTRDPFEVAAAREELTIIAEEYPELLEAVLNDGDVVQDRVESIGRTMYFERRNEVCKKLGRHIKV